MKFKRTVLKGFLLAIFFAILVFLHLVELPGRGRILSSLSNAGHIPFFGILSVIFMSLSRRFFRNSIRLFWHYLIALISTLLVGAVLELAQIFGSRDADIWDLFRDGVGAIIFLGLYAVYDRETAGLWQKYGYRIRRIVTFLAVFLVILGFAPVVFWGIAHINRNRVFPMICSFDSFWERAYCETVGAELAVVSPPADWKRAQNDYVGRVTFMPATFSQFSIFEPVPDWSGYSSLAFEVYSELHDQVTITLRIEDEYHNNEFNDRYNKDLTISPGLNRQTIPLEEVRVAPLSREMDMTKIGPVIIFAGGIDRPLTLYLDNFRLQK
jgi:hypothetical protein